MTTRSARLGQARILVTNFHAFLRRDTFEAGIADEEVLAGRDGDLDHFRRQGATLWCVDVGDSGGLGGPADVQLPRAS